jgi:hypothetical protein
MLRLELVADTIINLVAQHCWRQTLRIIRIALRRRGSRTAVTTNLITQCLAITLNKSKYHQMHVPAANGFHCSKAAGGTE